MTDPYFNTNIPPHIPPNLVHDFNIYDFEGRDPFVVIRGLHEAKLPEIFWTRHNGGHWVGLGAAAISAIVQDAMKFSSARGLVPDSANFDDTPFVPLMMDPPQHTVYRNVVAPMFRPNRIAAVKERIRQLTESLVSEIKDRRECEFMSDVAYQMPVIMFLELLELPVEDRATLVDIAHKVIQPGDGDRANPISLIFDYLRPTVCDRMRNPRSDVISEIARTRIYDRPLELAEVLKLTTTIMLAGIDTTSTSLGYLIRHLADTPMLRQRLIDQPSLIPIAVDESLRRFPPANAGRQTTADFTFRNVEMKKGEYVMWASASHNLDDSVFPDPMKFDIDRKRSTNLSFGTGPHFCIGSFLAKMEMKIFLEEWLKSVPHFAVAPGFTIEYIVGMIFGYKQLKLVMGSPT